MEVSAEYRIQNDIFTLKIKVVKQKWNLPCRLLNERCLLNTTVQDQLFLTAQYYM